MTSKPTGASALEESAAGALTAERARVYPNEAPKTRLARRTRGARLYASAGVVVAVLVVLVLFASANTHAAKLDWIVGSTRASLSWIILAAAIFGWLLGITTAVVVHRRTRRAS